MWTHPTIDGDRKAQVLRELAHQEGLRLEQVIAVGDGANDTSRKDATVLVTVNTPVTRAVLDGNFEAIWRPAWAERLWRSRTQQSRPVDVYISFLASETATEVANLRAALEAQRLRVSATQAELTRPLKRTTPGNTLPPRPAPGPSR